MISLSNILLYCFISLSSGRIFGNEWGWVFKPNGLNTLVANECVTRRSVYLVHSHSRTRGTHVSRMLGDVATRDTSQAVMNIIRAANGHSPVSRCSAEDVQSMEAEYQTCTKRIQYQFKCFDMSKEQQCLLLNSFLEDCTNGILGKCFETKYLQYISGVQKWSLASHSVFRERLAEVCLMEDEVTSEAPRLEPEVTSTRSVDRARLLRKYLRHPALANNV